MGTVELKTGVPVTKMALRRKFRVLESGAVCDRDSTLRECGIGPDQTLWLDWVSIGFAPTKRNNESTSVFWNYVFDKKSIKSESDKNGVCCVQ